MASNKDAIVDGYGAASDWIELFNAGDESVDLQGFRLTDDAEELDKWEFPSVELAPGEYLVVFASSRDGVDPAGHLHTNFALSASGEYLALVNPQGEVLSEFGPSQQDYPPLGPNASFGVAFDTVPLDAIAAQSATKYLVPTDSSVDSSWMLPEFDDAAWADGTARLGYEVSPGAYASLIQTPLPAGTKSVYVRIPFNVSDAGSVVGVLRMKYDDGFVAYLNGVEVARSNAPASLSYEANATSFRPREAAILEQAFNISSYSHLLQVGENVLAIHVLDSSSSPLQDLLAAPTLTVSTGSPILPLTAGGMVVATPGSANSQIVASDVVFSRGGGVISAPIDLELSGAGAGEVIRYSTDGSVPTKNSPIYETPISISSSTQVRARIFGPDGQIGAVRSEAFTRATPTVAEFSSDLPIIVLENFAAGLPGAAFEDAMFALYEPNVVTGRTSFADSPTLISIIGHHRRGASTYNQPKLNLRVEFRDENGHDVDVELLGMPGESDWILYAPHTTDHSLLRNAVMYDLSGQVVDYAVRTRFVEVFFNSNDGTLSSYDYMGVYVLMETIKLDENRVVSDEIVNDDGEMPGGYIFKIDRSDSEEDANWDAAGSPNATQLVHVDPKRSDMSQANVDYIRNYVAQFDAALYGPNWQDPELGYAAYIDVDSWIDHHLLRTFSREKDSLAFSEFLHKPQGEKLQLGPAWDFDRSAASEGSHNLNLSAEGWTLNEHQYRLFQYGWWNRLFSDPNFKQKWMDRWQELRETVYSDANLVAVVQGHSEEIEESYPRNVWRWPEASPNGGDYADPEAEGFAAEVSHLTNWLLARAAWIDDQMIAQPTIAFAAGESPDEVQVTLNHGGGVLYYTLDGSDPRANGGGVKAGALIYTGPFNVALGAKVNARVYDVAGASAPLTAWSGMETDTPQAVGDPNALRIVEVMYNPPGSADDTEYFELLNTGTATIQLTGFQITEFSSGGFTFSGGSLAPGERIVVVKSQAAFAAAYPNGTNVAAGEFSGSLANEGELVALLNPFGQTLQAFNYGDSNVVGWPETPDGDGWSLEYIGPLSAGENPLDGAPNDPFDDPANWRASLQEGGSPGTDGEPNAPVISGDFNGDGIVDGADFLAWQRGFGSANAQKENGDANNDQVVDAEDLNVWNNQYGGPPPQAVTASIVGIQTVTDAALPAPFVAPKATADAEPTRNRAGNYWIETLALANPFHRPAAPVTAVDSPSAELIDVAFAGLGDELVTRQISALDFVATEWPADEEAASEDEFAGVDARQIAVSLASPGIN